MRTSEAGEAARRALEICDACRFCDGYCAVFPAMELRRSITAADVSYLANLCHDCRGCYYACQYAPPHEFAINLPCLLTQVRLESYENYVRPRFLVGLFRRPGVTAACAVAFCVALALIASSPSRPSRPGPGAFYDVIPWSVMASAAGLALGLALVSSAIGMVRFWRDTGGRAPTARGDRAFATTLCDALTLRNLGGAGHGCNDFDESLSRLRRRFHHVMFYGLALCCGSTIVATIYDHVLGWQAPYPMFSPPVVLGALGGFGIVVGTLGLGWIKLTRDSAPVAPHAQTSDFALLALLLATAASGLLLLAMRDTAEMSALLRIHLGFVLSFFLLIPYSKGVHGLYRLAALLRAAMEREATRSASEK